MSFSAVNNGRSLSVVMPAHNEGAMLYDNILETAGSVSEFVDDLEIIVVDDGSTDNTYEEACRAASQDARVRVVRLSLNQGKGNALKEGTKYASKHYTAFVDADLDIHPKQLERFFVPIESSGLIAAVIGSKFHPESRVDYPAIRRFYSFGYYCMLRLLFNLNTRDTQTGLKLFVTKEIAPIMERILVKRYAYDIEVLSILCRRGLKIADAPVEVNFHEKINGIGFRDVLDTFLDTMAIFYRLRILRYYD